MTKLIQPAMPLEILAGRSLAMCVHPYAAWRRSVKGRVVVFLAYMTAGYALVFGALQLMSF